MAKNDKERPEVARAAQDVEAPRPKEQQGGFHIGRGGAGMFVYFGKRLGRETDMNSIANVAKAEADNTGTSTAGQPTEQGDENGARRNTQGLADKGKELLGKIGIGDHTKK